MRAKTILLVIILLLMFSFSLQAVSAQEITLSTTPTSTPAPAVIKYQLPYPGILPGHPLYFLKSARDKLLALLISNPLKRAEFDLLQTDKNIAAAEILFKQKADSALVFSSIAGARIYFEDAINKSIAAKKQGMDSSDLVKRLAVANIRHQEVVMAMTETKNKEDSERFKAELERLKELGKRTNKLTSQ